MPSKQTSSILALSSTRFSRSKKGCPALVGRSAVVTHIGDGCRAAGFLPIAMLPSLRHYVDSGRPPVCGGAQVRVGRRPTHRHAARHRPVHRRDGTTTTPGLASSPVSSLRLGRLLDCYRLERQLPGGIRTRWGMAPCHGAPRSYAKDTDENYLAVCQARETGENGLRLDAVGNFISSTVLRTLTRITLPSGKPAKP